MQALIISASSQMFLFSWSNPPQHSGATFSWHKGYLNSSNIKIFSWYKACCRTWSSHQVGHFFSWSNPPQRWKVLVHLKRLTQFLQRNAVMWKSLRSKIVLTWRRSSYRPSLSTSTSRTSTSVLQSELHWRTSTWRGTLNVGKMSWPDNDKNWSVISDSANGQAHLLVLYQKPTFNS